MIIKAGEIKHINEGLKEILNKELPVKPAYWLARIATKLEGELQTFEKARMGLINKHSKKDKDGKPDPDEPAWFKAYREAKDAEIAELKNTFEQQKKEKALSALTDKVKTHDKLKGIPASFLKGRNLVPGSEDEIDQLAASIEADYSAFKQDMAEQGVNIAVPPAGGGATKEGAALGKAIAEKKNTNSSDGVKGKTI